MADWVGVSFCRVITTIASLLFAAEDRQQVIERGVYPTEITDVAPIDSAWVVAEVVVGQLLQPSHSGHQAICLLD